jgi:hypothetical protein
MHQSYWLTEPAESGPPGETIRRGRCADLVLLNITAASVTSMPSMRRNAAFTQGCCSSSWRCPPVD